MPRRDGSSCPGCGLPNYSGLCPVCRGDEDAARSEGMPYEWPDEDEDYTNRDFDHEAAIYEDFYGA